MRIGNTRLLKSGFENGTPQKPELLSENGTSYLANEWSNHPKLFRTKKNSDDLASKVKTVDD